MCLTRAHTRNVRGSRRVKRVNHCKDVHRGEATVVIAQRLSHQTHVGCRKPTCWTEVRPPRLPLVQCVSACRNRARRPSARIVAAGFEAVRHRIVSWRSRTIEATELAEAATAGTEMPMSNVRRTKRQNDKIQRARDGLKVTRSSLGARSAAIVSCLAPASP